MHSDTNTTTTTSETRDFAVRVIHAFQALDVLEWALHSRLADDDDGNHLEAFCRPVIEARNLLQLFHARFLGGSREDIDAIVRGDAQVMAGSALVDVGEDDGLDVSAINGKLVIQRSRGARTFAMQLSRSEALDLVHNLTRELGPEAGVLVPEGGS